MSTRSSPHVVLVTGASGFIGGYLVHRLVELGHEVHILARANSDFSALPAAHTYTSHLGDVTDAASLRRACERASALPAAASSKPSTPSAVSSASTSETSPVANEPRRKIAAVFHLAAHIGYTRAERAKMQLINVEGTRNVLDACARCGVRRLVYCSSVVAVGALDACPAATLSAGAGLMDETFEYNMRAHGLGYFDTKREAEELVLAFARSPSESRAHAATLTAVEARSAPLEIVVLCPSNVYGRGDAIKASRGTQVKVARGRLPFYSGGGINIVRVQDVAEAFVAAWHKGRHGERYIIGGDNITVRELLGMYAAAAGVSPPRWQLPGPLMLLAGHLGILPLEKIKPAQMFLYYDSAKARRELGFDPKPARLAIAESVEFMRSAGMLDSTSDARRSGSGGGGWRVRALVTAATVAAAAALVYWWRLRSQAL